MGWLKHVASPHKTRVCGFISLPSSEQLLNNSFGKKKKNVHAFKMHTSEQCCAASVNPGSCHPVLLPMWNKLVIESRPCRQSSNQLQKWWLWLKNHIEDEELIWAHRLVKEEQWNRSSETISLCHKCYICIGHRFCRSLLVNVCVRHQFCGSL